MRKLVCPVNTEPAKLAKAVRPKKEAPKPAVELPVLPPDNFELPEVIKAAKKVRVCGQECDGACRAQGHPPCSILA